MNLLERLQQSQVPALARHFARFCRECDPDAHEHALLGAALLAARNLEGDTCIELDALAEQALFPDRDGQPLLHAPALEPWLDALHGARFVGTAEQTRPLILEGRRLYLHRHWQEEAHIARALLARNAPVPVQPEPLRKRLDALFEPKDPAHAEGARGQKLAAAMALTRRLAIITGGPGTGKTTTVARILALLLEANPELRILLAAPTGKAAARLTESIGEQCETLHGQVADDILARMRQLQASTLHRLLGWQREGFEYHADNPLPCDCLLIDETSMVDQGLMASTLRALPAHARLILLGDRHQLSSVEAGSMLGELTGRDDTLALTPARAEELEQLTGELPSRPLRNDAPPLHGCIVELAYSYRFASGGGIGRLAEAIKRGDLPAIEALLDSYDEELDWIDSPPDQPAAEIVRLAIGHYRPVLEAPDAETALARFNETRVLTAHADGPWGESTLRERLEDGLRRRGLISAPTGQPFHGQPLIILRNDSETGLYNGDTGILWREDPTDEDAPLLAWFEQQGDLVPFSLHQLPEWRPAWTLTVHRSQGSEYDRVLLVLPAVESRILSRELIYTGITRARKHCTLTGKRQTLLAACRRHEPRFSGLHERLTGDSGDNPE